MVPIPPDLSRLGDELQAAAARAAAERRNRRRRLGRALTSAAAGLLTVVVLAPAALGPESGATSLLTAESGNVLVRPPDRRPVEFHPSAPDADAVLVRPPSRPPLPSLIGRRDA
jgi:hypothetical protein